MPTGYTYQVTEDNYSFEDFVWNCAKAFGAFIHMRDEPNSAKIIMPKESFYYQDQLDEARLELERAESMTLDEAALERDAYYEKTKASNKKAMEKQHEEFKKLHAMQLKVLSWEPPTDDHVELRNFMLQQLEETIKYDCDFSYYEKVLLEPKQSVQDWLDNYRIQAQRDVVRYAKNAQEEQDKYHENINWINKLIDNVPLPGDKK